MSSELPEFSEEGLVVAGVPLEVFEEGLKARRSARKLLKAKEVDVESCQVTRVMCEGAFKSMRNSFLVDCREQTHRCNRLRDLMDECQTACEAAFARCRTKPPPAAVWQKVQELRGQWYNAELHGVSSYGIPEQSVLSLQREIWGGSFDRPIAYREVRAVQAGEGIIAAQVSVAMQVFALLDSCTASHRNVPSLTFQIGHSLLVPSQAQRAMPRDDVPARTISIDRTTGLAYWCQQNDCFKRAVLWKHFERGSLVSAAAALALWRTFWGGPEECCRAWSASPCAEQLCEAQAILRALPVEAQLLPISGYLPQPPPWLPPSWADFLLGLDSACLEEAENFGLVSAVGRWQAPEAPSVPPSLRRVAESLGRLRGSLPHWGDGSSQPSILPAKFGLKKGKVGQ
ncbi:unnamed protein product, partial [Symbiodinium pilosum]